jgi:hypothetical protein
MTGGFAAVGEPNMAVCLLPGTEVAFESEVECEHFLGFFPNWKLGRKLGEKVARFRQVKKDQPHVHLGIGQILLRLVAFVLYGSPGFLCLRKQLSQMIEGCGRGAGDLRSLTTHPSPSPPKPRSGTVAGGAGSERVLTLNKMATIALRSNQNASFCSLR